MQPGRVAACHHLYNQGELFGQAALYAVHMCCCQARPHSSEELFGGNAVVLCGDPSQLPAPSDTALQTRKDSLAGTGLFKLYQKFDTNFVLGMHQES